MTVDQTVAIAGLGAIGLKVAEHLAAGKLPGYRLAATSARDETRARARLAELGCVAPLLPPAELARHADIVIECLPAAAFASVAEPAVAAGKVLVVLTASALLERSDLIEEAKRTGARILVPSGALLGFDAMRAVAESEIQSVRMTTRKPPAGLAGAPHIERMGIALAGITEPTCVFSGTAREGARGFPANVNVAAALSLAGIGPDRTMLEIWADPTVTRNIHQIEVEADSARFSLLIEGLPSLENPRTGRLTPLSVIALLRGLTAPFRVGS